MGSWEKLNETSIPPKELFCSELNLEDITNEDYAHVQTVWDVFEIKIRDKVILYCLQMYLKTLEVSVLKYMDLILLIFLSAPGLAWQSCLEKTGVNLELLTDIDMLLKVGEGTRGGICQAIYRYAKANNKHMGNYVKKKHHIPCIWMQTTCMDGPCLKNLLQIVIKICLDLMKKS